MLFYLNNEDRSSIKPVKSKVFADIGWKEKDLENLVAKNMPKLIPENQLMVLFQERPFEEAADIFALDKSGDLYIFELKRWRGHQENLLQVLRYGQKYGQYSYEQLQDMLRKYKKMPDLHLADKHYEYFEDSIDSNLEQSDFNREQHFVVITNGTDIDTLNAIKYWQDKGLKIDSIIYRVYKVGKDYIFEFNPYNPEGEVILEEEEGYFIVNTNLTWCKTCCREMLEQEKAAAYYERKYGIARIKRGDTVFLYHTGLGVVAYGKAIDDYKVIDRSGNKDEEYFIPLRFDWKIDPDSEREKAVRPWKINEKLGTRHAFRQTVISIPEKMAEVVKGLAKNKMQDASKKEAL